MLRGATLFGLLLLALNAAAQFPFTRTFELRAGLQRPRVDMLAQDDQGFLWAASDQGLLRTDGELTDAIWTPDNDAVTAISANGGSVFAATADGFLLCCSGFRCDTIGHDTTLLRTPAKSLWMDERGTLWIGTYGSGILLRSGSDVRRIGTEQGLGDEHVNALCPVGNGRVAVATDQGIAVCDRNGNVLARIGEGQGAPDNLVLSLAAGDSGHFWAGTHHSGIFRFDPSASDPHIVLLDSAWQHGAVNALTATRTSVWAATSADGVVVIDAQRGLGAYSRPPDASPDHPPVTSVITANDGAVWWCDGTEHVVRADPNELVVPEHEQVDLRNITALCADRQGHIWFATDKGIFRHDAAFSDKSRLWRADVNVDPQRAVVALQALDDGTIWAGTFGQGAIRIDPHGKITRFALAQGLSNDNVLAIDAAGNGTDTKVWFATLGGVCVYTADPSTGAGSFRKVPVPGSGFVYDILALPDGSVLAATDGNGVVRIGPDGKAAEIANGQGASQTYYSLCRDADGTVWACGPSTGICKVMLNGMECSAKDRAPFDGDVFALAAYQGHVLAFGKNGLAVHDPATGRLHELGEAFGLNGVGAELNTVCTDSDGALWLACGLGLVRLTPDARALEGAVRTFITRFSWGDQDLPLDTGNALRYDQDFLTFRFAAPYYAAPEQVLYNYRLMGFDTIVRVTRDREVTWSRLPPGDYRFEVRASLGTDDVAGPWTSFAFTIAGPWWRSPWALGAGLLLLAVVFYFVIRAREERVRYRERVEKEKARFQLDALRSQVNPHFLFNSFNTLIDLIENDPTSAVAHVEHLSDFFREILAVRDRESIPLSEEMRLVDTYFYLEQRRFGDRIALHVDIDQEHAGQYVPPLTVQLLVENALKHNTVSAGAVLSIIVKAEGGYLSISNPFRPRSEPLRSTGFGLESIRKRYLSLTDRPVEFERSGDHFVVRLPLLPAP